MFDNIPFYELWQHEENYLYLQYFKENAVKLGVEVLIMVVNDSSSKEIQIPVPQIIAGNIDIKTRYNK